VRRRCLMLVLLFAGPLLAAEARAQALYWLDTNFGAPTLNKADALGNAISGVALPAGTLPEGLACDASGNVYWAEGIVAGAHVRRAGPLLADVTTLVGGGTSLRGVAVDVAGGKLYWTTSNLVLGSSVRRSALDGSGAVDLVTLGPGANPRGIAVDHAGGKIYWADFDQDALYRANLDGSGVELWLPLIANSHPYGVAFDASTQQLYWTEYAGKIRRALTAGGITVTLLGGVANPTYIALDPAAGQMYWSEGGAGAQHIYRGPMAGGLRVPLALPLTTYGGLAFQPNPLADAPPSAAPLDFELAPLAPNPARDPVRAAFALPRESHVRLSVIDLQGREVAVLADGTYPAGRHEATWDTHAGRVPAGVYFVRMVVGGRTWMRRLVRMR
jgi:hypothetical protein